MITKMNLKEIESFVDSPAFSDPQISLNVSAWKYDINHNNYRVTYCEELVNNYSI